MWLVVSACSGFLAVVLGAFGAHGLKKSIGALEDSAARFEWWETAAHYHLIHSVILALVGLLILQTGSQAPRALQVAGIAFSVGMLIFSGSLYTMTLTGIRLLGAITPLGGLALLCGWAALGWGAWQLRGLA
ncbi:MAG: DUF423 domain-containing protein [Polyangiaceae bacterium]|nr:DUF423 domain-containing protein [Polyangiaceae bacterium]